MTESDTRALGCNTQKLRILLVDDNELLLQALAASLIDYHVTTSRSGQRAIEFLENNLACDVIVADVRMPDMPGPELFEAVHGRWPALAERFVFITGNPDGMDQVIANCAIRTRVSALPLMLVKPVMPDDLHLAIQAVAHRKQGGSSRTAPVTEVSKQIGGGAR